MAFELMGAEEYHTTSSAVSSGYNKGEGGEKDAVQAVHVHGAVVAGSRQSKQGLSAGRPAYSAWSQEHRALGRGVGVFLSPVRF
jgi:hypothetical protein